MQGLVTILADLVKLLANFLAQTIKRHWGKMILTLVFAVVFFVLSFPYGDLSSLASKQIYQATGVSTRIGNLSLALNPSPGIQVTDLEVNLSAPPVSMKSVRLFPSVLSTLLNSDVYFSAEAKNLFGGDIALTRSAGERVPDTDRIKEELYIRLSGVQLVDVLSTLENLTVAQPIQTPVKVSGSLSLDSDVILDPMFTEQPEAEILLEGEAIEFPPQSVPTQMGPLSMPRITWSKSRIKGRLVGGELIIEEGVLGTKGDPMQMKLKGKLALSFRKTARGVTPLLGAYQFDIDLTMAQSVDGVLGLLLTPIAGDYKSSTSSGSRYLFRASSSRIGSPPRTQSIQPF